MAPSPVPKGQEAHHLPSGSEVRMRLGADGLWHGSLLAEGLRVSAKATGYTGCFTSLARAWLNEKGVATAGRP